MHSILKLLTDRHELSTWRRILLRTLAGAASQIGAAVAGVGLVYPGNPGIWTVGVVVLAVSVFLEALSDRRAAGAWRFFERFVEVSLTFAGAGLAVGVALSFDEFHNHSGHAQSRRLLVIFACILLVAACLRAVLVDVATSERAPAVRRCCRRDTVECAC